MPLMTTFEHAVLTAQDFVYAADFDWLIEQNFIGFTVQRSRGTWQLVVGHYLGVIQLPSGTVLEVLPKIAQFSEVNLGETRAWVKTMLATIWPGLNPKQLPVIAPQTRFDHAQESIPMWLGQCFYQWFNQYQPNQHYQTTEQNQSYIQGKLLLTQQLRHNAHQPHKFYSERDQFAPDTASNRLVKTAYQRLTQLGILSLSALPMSWQGVTALYQPTLAQIENVFQQSQQELQQRMPALRQPANMLLRLSYAILTAQQALPSVDKAPSPSLLINMQTAFEQWVTHVAKQLVTHVTRQQFSHVQAQHSQALVMRQGLPLLSMKPDLLIDYHQGQQRIVADIKWKNIGSVGDIRLSDMYQLLTYASETAARQAWLIYPTIDRHQQAIPIELVKPRDTQFWLVPFVVTQGQLSLPPLSAKR
jgi:5-methylcytosine-specific restriction enzyme subunit McrC